MRELRLTVIDDVRFARDRSAPIAVALAGAPGPAITRTERFTVESGPSEFTPSLDFSEARNSQYLVLLIP